MNERRARLGDGDRVWSGHGVLHNDARMERLLPAQLLSRGAAVEHVRRLGQPSTLQRQRVHSRLLPCYYFTITLTITITYTYYYYY